MHAILSAFSEKGLSGPKRGLVFLPSGVAKGRKAAGKEEGGGADHSAPEGRRANLDEGVG